MPKIFIENQLDYMFAEIKEANILASRKTILDYIIFNEEESERLKIPRSFGSFKVYG